MHHSLYCYFSHTFLQILYIGFEQTTFKFSESEWYAFQKKAEQHHTKLCFTCCKLGVVLAFNRSFKSLNKNQLEFQTPKKLMRDLGDHPQCLILIQFQNSLKVDSFFSEKDDSGIRKLSRKVMVTTASLNQTFENFFIKYRKILLFY